MASKLRFGESVSAQFFMGDFGCVVFWCPPDRLFMLARGECQGPLWIDSVNAYSWVTSLYLAKNPQVLWMLYLLLPSLQQHFSPGHQGGQEEEQAHPHFRLYCLYKAPS